jgi:predicted amidohydrolase
MDTLTVAAVNWKIRPAASVEDFRHHFLTILERVVEAGAELVVFPENFNIELLARHEYSEQEVPEILSSYGGISELFSEELEDLHLWIVAGSRLVRAGDGFENACDVFHNGGLFAGRQSKVKLTTYERNVWKLSSGVGLSKFSESRLGVTICYDCEFPESGRILAERGVLLQCVPAFTETMHGFHRVRKSCHARAIENQIFVIHSSLVGSLGKEPVPFAVGSSAIIGPCVEPFPDNGVLAETSFNEDEVAVATLDFSVLLAARETGDVRNWNDRSVSDWASDR